MINVNKKILIFVLIGIVFLCSCSNITTKNHEKESTNYNDSQENLISYQSINRYAASENGYYFIRNNDDGSLFLYEVDENKQECHPLCNKVDCLHDKETIYSKQIQCNAYVDGAREETLVFNNGFFYYVMEDVEKDKDGNEYMVQRICKKSVDGTKQQVLYTIEDYNIFGLKAHQGYFYIDASKWDKGTAYPEQSCIYRIPIEKKGIIEKIVNLNKFRKKYLNMWVFDDRYYNDNLFLQIQYTKNNKEQQTIIQYNLNTQNWTDLGKYFTKDIQTKFTIFNDKLIFGNGYKIYEYNISTKKQKEILDCQNIIKGYKYFIPYCNDGENIYITASNSYKDHSQKIIICNKSYRAKVQKLPLKFTPTVGFDDKAFVYLNDSKQVLYWIDKSTYKSKKIYEFPIQE